MAEEKQAEEVTAVCKRTRYFHVSVERVGKGQSVRYESQRPQTFGRLRFSALDVVRTLKCLHV